MFLPARGWRRAGTRDDSPNPHKPQPEPVHNLAAPPAEPVEEASARHPTPAFWTAIAITGAGLVTGAVLGGLALQKEDQFDDNPTNAIADQGERFALFADVGFGIAAAGGVTALILYLTSGRKGGAATDEQPAGEQPAADQPQVWSVTPTLTKHNLGLAGQLRF